MADADDVTHLTVNPASLLPDVIDVSSHGDGTSHYSYADNWNRTGND